MYFSPFLSSRKGFSILVALGTIGVLLIIVMSLANIYVNEMKLSRMQYNNILAYAQAEGAFEYAMLKIANHREGFQDSMQTADPDALMFSGSTDRTKNTTVHYEIISQENSGSFIIADSDHLIIPLFSGTGGIIHGSMTSVDPRYFSGISQVSRLDISLQNPDNISWSIIAMSGSMSVSISGTGFILGDTTIGVMRLSSLSCYDIDGRIVPVGTPMNSDGSCPFPYNADSIEYYYDLTGSVNGFLQSKITPFGGDDRARNMNIQNPYLLIFNSGSTTSINIQTDAPFTLPVTKIVTEARKSNALQRIEFTEDKSKYYDAIRYGIYNSD